MAAWFWEHGRPWRGHRGDRETIYNLQTGRSTFGEDANRGAAGAPGRRGAKKEKLLQLVRRVWAMSGCFQKAGHGKAKAKGIGLQAG